MSTYENENVTLGIEQFCSILDQLAIEDKSSVSKTEDKLTSIPTNDKVLLILRVLSSQKSYTIKAIAITKLKSILLSLCDKKHLAESLVSYSKHCLINLLVDEQNEQHQAELLSLHILLIKITSESVTQKCEDISELISTCVQSEHHHLTRIVRSKLLEDTPTLFGKEKNQQIIQYKNLLRKCVYKFSEKPQVTMFAMDFLNKIFLKYSSRFCIKTLSRVMPSIIYAMGTMVLRTEALSFMNYMSSLLHGYSRFFKTYSKKIIFTVLRILTNSKIEKTVAIEIYRWLSEFIFTMSKDVKQRCYDYIPYIIDQIIMFHISCYPNDSEELFEKCTNSSAFSFNAFFSYNCLYKVVVSIGKEIMHPLLTKKSKKLLESIDWQRIDTGITLFSIIILKTKTGIISEPQEIFESITPFFVSNIPSIAFSAIKLTKYLCYNYNESKFRRFHLKAFSLVVKVTADQDRYKIKSLCLEVVYYIVASCFCKAHEIEPSIIGPSLLDVLNTILTCESSDHMVSLTNSLFWTINYVFQFKLLGDKQNTLVLQIITVILRIVDKMFFIPIKRCLVYCYLDWITNVISFYSTENSEDFVSLIVVYVNEFNKSHNLSSDYLEIQPFFIPLLAKLSKYKSRSLATLFPKIGASISKLISIFVGPLSISNNLNCNYDPLVLFTYGRPHSFTREYEANLVNLWESISLFVENYSESFSPYIITYLKELLRILDNDNIGFFNEKLKKQELYQLLKCFLYHGNTNEIKNFWNDCLKNKLIKMLNNPLNVVKTKLINYFTKFITISELDDMMGPIDILLLSKIFSNTIDYIRQSNEQSLESKNQMVNENSISLYRNDDFNIIIALNKLQKSIIKILRVYKEKIMEIIIPLYKTILTYPKIENWDIFFEFLIPISDEVLNLIPPKIIGEIEIFTILLNFFINGSLSIFQTGQLFEKSRQQILTLKNMHPLLFKKLMKSMSTSSKF